MSGFSIRGVGTGKILPWNGYFKFTLPVTSELWYCNISPDAGLFIEEGVFNNSSPSSTWDFLLNGEADVKVRMPTTIIPAIYTKLTPASGNISDAQITINGTYESLELESNTHEYVLADSVYRIEWTDYRYYDMCPEDYLLYYSIDNGLNWTPITGTPVSNTCYYDWLVPEVTAENCLIKNEDANEILFDISNESFAIYECSSPPAGDYTSDCYINLSDFRIIASNWLETDGYTLSDLLSLCENWLNCSNALDPDCSL